MRDEIVYEWGKSLTDFRTREDIGEQVSEVRALGWDVLRASGFRGGVKIGEVGQKVGGRRDWTAVSRGGDGRWVHYVYDDGIGDIAEARELADAVMRERSFKYLRAEGSGEGNPALAAGAEVTVKQVGKAWSGDYIAEAVIHDLSMETGYVTEFHLKRNMLDEEFVRLVKGRGASRSDRGQGGAIATGAAAASAGSAADEEEDGPEFRGLRWKKDGKEAEEALVDDEVTLCCEVKNIADGETVNVKIWEHDEDGDHDPITDMSGEVKDGKVEIPWKVEYHADDDDSSSSCAKEIEKYGYTVPEYFFVAEYNGVKSEEKECNLLYVKGWGNHQIVDKETGEPLVNSDYALLTPEGKFITGKSDENGYIRLEGLEIGKYTLIR